MAKAGGIFECDSCGMQYDKTRIQEMVQEIKGTVKVEGTVQVAGTVTVDEHKSKENLLKRGRIALESGDWMEAKKHFDGVLNYDADCIEAYYGKCCAVCYCDNIHKAIAKKAQKYYCTVNLQIYSVFYSQMLYSRCILRFRKQISNWS